MSPLHLLIKNNTLYQLTQARWSVVFTAEALNALSHNVVDKFPYITPLFVPRNEYSIYWEYMKKELGSNNPFKPFD